MLHLVNDTPAAWLSHCLAHLDEVLVDHAHCEHKAAVTALSFISKYPDDPRLVTALGALARDEADHFARAAALCIARGLQLGHPQKDPYVDGLLGAVRRENALQSRVDRLLCCALIEGRSCERLKLLAGALPTHLGTNGSDELSRFYDELWREEATHHLLFIELAERSLARAGHADARARIVERLQQLAAREGELVATLPIRAAIH